MNLNGYSLKAVKMMETPRGISYTGDICYSDTKIGDAYNKGDGGITQVYLSHGYHNHSSVLNEEFVSRLFLLNDYEKIFKTEMRRIPGKGMTFVTYTDPFDLRCILCDRDEALDKIVSRILEAEPGREIESIEVFRSLDDFNITQPHELLSHSRLNAVYAELLDIGINGDLSPAENAALQGLLEKIVGMMPGWAESEPAQETEITEEQSAEEQSAEM